MNPIRCKTFTHVASQYRLPENVLTWYAIFNTTSTPSCKRLNLVHKGQVCCIVVSFFVDYLPRSKFQGLLWYQIRRILAQTCKLSDPWDCVLITLTSPRSLTVDTLGKFSATGHWSHAFLSVYATRKSHAHTIFSNLIVRIIHQSECRHNPCFRFVQSLNNACPDHICVYFAPLKVSL